MSAEGWLRRDNFPAICGCCGKLVVSCWERGHSKACDECRPHFWTCGPKGDKPCDGKALASGLRGEHGSPQAVSDTAARATGGVVHEEQ